MIPVARTVPTAFAITPPLLKKKPAEESLFEVEVTPALTVSAPRLSMRLFPAPASMPEASASVFALPLAWVSPPSAASAPLVAVATELADAKICAAL